MMYLLCCHAVSEISFINVFDNCTADSVIRWQMRLRQLDDTIGRVTPYGTPEHLLRIGKPMIDTSRCMRLFMVDNSRRSSPASCVQLPTTPLGLVGTLTVRAVSFPREGLGKAGCKAGQRM